MVKRAADMTNTGETQSVHWRSEQLQAFALADDFQVSPFYADGHTYGTPTWIWSVVVNHQLFIRAWNGPQSRWYRSAVKQQAGRIHLAEHNYTVYFAAIHDETLNVVIDQAYRQKYAGSPYLLPMLQAGPRLATVCVAPRCVNESEK